MEYPDPPDAKLIFGARDCVVWVVCVVRIVVGVVDPGAAYPTPPDTKLIFGVGPGGTYGVKVGVDGVNAGVDGVYWAGAGAGTHPLCTNG